MRHAVPLYWEHTGRYMSNGGLETLNFQVAYLDSNQLWSRVAVVYTEATKGSSAEPPPIRNPVNRSLCCMLRLDLTNKSAVNDG